MPYMGKRRTFFVWIYENILQYLHITREFMLLRIRFLYYFFFGAIFYINYYYHDLFLIKKWVYV